MILASGCFDGLSAPHVRYLLAAKRIALQTGEDLVVTLERDSYIRRMKGRDPHWPQADRAVALSAVAVVDDVYVQPEDEDVPAVIRKLKPRVFVKGPEWADRMDIAHMVACYEVGAELRFTRSFGKHWSDVRA